ncbi:MAG: nucleotidyltransferase family protein [Parasphingorhabdus sp.]|uniref:nucleotidyltransferase family protein n=1 Tax=Parasphingorhabdus sp. TaxID=2709688 RepID=UPI003266BFAD
MSSEAMIENPLTKSLADILREKLILGATGSLPPISQEVAIHAGKRHRIAPILYSLLKSGQIEATSASEKFLHDSYRHAGLQAAQQQRVRSRIHNILINAQLHYVELKGRGLAEQLYANPVARFSKDIDILIRKKDSTSALQALSDAGFIAKAKRSRKTNKLARYEMWAAKDTSLYDPDFDQQIELHSRLLQSEPANFSTVFMDSVLDSGTPQTTNPFYVFYLIMHGAHCHWASLKWILDLVLIARTSGVSANDMADLARTYHSLSAVSASVEFIDAVFPNSLPQDWITLARQIETSKSQELLAAFSEMLSGSPREVKQAGYPFADWYMYDGGINYWQAGPRRLIKPFFRFL